MLFIKQVLKTEEVNAVSNMLEEVNEVMNPIIEEEPVQEENCVSKYITSYVTGYYQKSMEDIENTKIGNRITRKRNLSQIMRESFFYGANRFGNNFIA